MPRSAIHKRSPDVERLTVARRSQRNGALKVFSFIQITGTGLWNAGMNSMYDHLIATCMSWRASMNQGCLTEKVTR